jgi:hypothetical protein
MRFHSVAGCCAAYNIANLGGVHGHTRARSQEEFELRFLNKPLARMNFAITNNYQDVEREYLSKMGFKATQIADLQMHTISSTDLRRYLNERTPHLREYEAKKKKEKAEVTKSKFGQAPIAGTIFMGAVTSRQIQNLRPAVYDPMNQDHNTAWRQAIQRHYGVAPMLHRWSDNTVRAVRQRTYRALYDLRIRHGVL